MKNPNNEMYSSFSALLIFICFLFSQYGMEAQTMYKKREMRGVWIATVGNIDWPQSRKQTTAEKIADLREMIGTLHELGFNTVFFQVRTECDALYASRVEPWSYWLTGEQGRAPEPYFDPLQTVIDESRARNMEVHAWFNPYRAVKNVNGYPASDNHVSQRHPEWLLAFKDYQMLNPGLPEVRAYIKTVIDDVISRYDVDGIHFDDYFYPYAPKVSKEDLATFRNESRGLTDIEAWRRDNINLMIQDIHTLINKKKPWIKFGVSPFGIVENKYANTSGLESYNVLYCDPLTWIKEGTVDYVLPQLYWDMEHPKAPFKPLFHWWESVCSPAALWVGHYSSSLLSERFTGSRSELYEQLRLVRESPSAGGSVFFSARSLVRNLSNVQDSLEYNVYLYRALQPVLHWKKTTPPQPVDSLKLAFTDNRVTLSWKAHETGEAAYPVTQYAVYRFYDHEPINLNDPRAIVALLPGTITSYSEMVFYRVSSLVYVVTALDRLSNESTQNKPVILEATK